MANYKKISELETVTEVTKSMNVLIEDDGVLKKASSGGNIGGGGGNTIMVDATNGYTCSHSFNEALSLFNSAKPFNLVIKRIDPSTSTYLDYIYPKVIRYQNDYNIFKIFFNRDDSSSLDYVIYWLSDGSFTTDFDDNSPN